MSKTYRYRVTTICTATVEEEWTVTSDRPLTEAQLADVLVGGELDGEDIPDGITSACIDEEISDEHDRLFNNAYLLDEEETRPDPFLANTEVR